MSGHFIVITSKTKKLRVKLTFVFIFACTLNVCLGFIIKINVRVLLKVHYE